MKSAVTNLLFRPAQMSLFLTEERKRMGDNEQANQKKNYLERLEFVGVSSIHTRCRMERCYEPNSTFKENNKLHVYGASTKRWLVDAARRIHANAHTH